MTNEMTITPDKMPEVEKAKQSIQELVTTATAITKVETEGEVRAVSELAATIKSKAREVEAIRTSITKPINDSLANTNAFFKSLVAPLLAAESNIKNVLVAYQRAQMAEAARQRALLEAQMAKEAAKAAKANPTATPAPVPAPVVHVEAPKSIGNMTAREVWTFEVVDIDKVPGVFIEKTVRRNDVLAAIKDGMHDIPGLKITKDVQMSIRQ
jgi:hypothetical protein